MTSFPIKKTRHQGGFTLVELLITVGLIGVLATLSLNLLANQNKSSKWGRVAKDYIHQLGAVYGKSKAQYGNGPLAAQKCNSTTTCTLVNAFDDGTIKGVGALLKDWETTVTYNNASPRNLAYPSGIVLYLQPDDTNVPDPNNEIPNGVITYAGATNNIAGSFGSDWEFLLLDMNGTDAPNSTQSNGDRVLLYVDDDTGRIMTGWQFCLKNGGTEIVADRHCRITSGGTYNFYASFYDVYTGYDAINAGDNRF